MTLAAAHAPPRRGTSADMSNAGGHHVARTRADENARFERPGRDHGDTDNAIPPGWSHNPTSPRRRALLATLATVGLAVATYLVLYQFRLYHSLWDPWDAEKVVDATFPVPDAFAGVLAYGAELLLLAIGGRDRWRSLPWACLALGAILATGVVVSIGLIIVQPAVIGAWCGFCLLSAALSFVLAALGMDEALAAWQHIKRARDKGVPLGDAFWGRAAAASPSDS